MLIPWQSIGDGFGLEARNSRRYERPAGALGLDTERPWRDDLEERRPAVDVHLIVILPGLLALAVLPYKLVPENSLEAQAGVPLLKRPIIWAAVVFVVFVALNILIW